MTFDNAIRILERHDAKSRLSTLDHEMAEAVETMVAGLNERLLWAAKAGMRGWWCNVTFHHHNACECLACNLRRSCAPSFAPEFAPECTHLHPGAHQKPVTNEGSAG